MKVINIADQRLSKLQKWILTTCYRVTVLLDNEILVPIKGKIYTNDSSSCSHCLNNSNFVRFKPINVFDGRDNMRVVKDKWNCITNRCTTETDSQSCSYFELFKEDILLSYFELSISNRSAMFSKTVHFSDSPEYRKAQVTLTRTLKNLEGNDFIGIYGYDSFSRIIRLTDKGAFTAAKLLGLEYVSPMSLTEEEIRKEERKLSSQIELLKLQLQA